MLTLLLGPDDFSKKHYADELAKKQKASLEFLVEPASLPVGQLISQDLFSGKKVFVIENAMTLLDENNVTSLAQSPNEILFLADRIDKRTKFGKDLGKHKDVTVREFPLPHGKELNDWITNRVNILKGNIEAAAAEELAVRLGRDGAKETKFGGKVVSVEEVYSLWQAESEIQKLLALGNGAPVTKEMVISLVPENGETDVFDIINAIAEKNMSKALSLINSFLENENAADEKGKIIQLGALLAEQFRNVAVVQSLLQRRVPEDEILRLTEWKTGRLFVMKKIASRFSSKLTLETLSKLSSLDLELKTGSTPPRVLLNLIVAQLV